MSVVDDKNDTVRRSEEPLSDVTLLSPFVVLYDQGSSSSSLANWSLTVMYFLMCSVYSITVFAENLCMGVRTPLTEESRPIYTQIHTKAHTHTPTWPLFLTQDKKLK